MWPLDPASHPGIPNITLLVSISLVGEDNVKEIYPY